MNSYSWNLDVNRSCTSFQVPDQSKAEHFRMLSLLSAELDVNNLGGRTHYSDDTLFLDLQR